MIFMSQSGLIDTERNVDWALWYLKHLRVMVTVSGIHSAQRFETNHQGWSPSLAMYTVASADVFDDCYYLKVRGMGPWRPLIDQRFYKRILFDGLETAPSVARDSALVVTDRAHCREKSHGSLFTWLSAVGLDRTTFYRGIAVVQREQARSFESRPGVAVYFPSTPRYTPGDTAV